MCIRDRVQASNLAVQAAENEYNRQVQLDAAGEANKMQTAQRTFEDEKKRQAEALENQKKIQRQQILLDTALQASNLITAVSSVYKIFAALGPAGVLLGVGAGTLMIGSFLAAKVKAFAATKQEFAEGGWGEVGGGTHASGNDTNMGFKTQKGKTAYAQKGELFGVVRHERAGKYKKAFGMAMDGFNSGNIASVLPDIAKVLGAQGGLNEHLAQLGRSGANLQLKLDGKTDTRKMESLLERIANKGGTDGESLQVIAPGITRERKGNLTRTVHHLSLIHI